MLQNSIFVASQYPKNSSFQFDNTDHCIHSSTARTANKGTCPGRHHFVFHQVEYLFATMILLIREVFSKLNNLFFGYFDPINIFFYNKNKYFLGWPKRYFGRNGNTGDLYEDQSHGFRPTQPQNTDLLFNRTSRSEGNRLVPQCEEEPGVSNATFGWSIGHNLAQWLFFSRSIG